MDPLLVLITETFIAPYLWFYIVIFWGGIAAFIVLTALIIYQEIKQGNQKEQKI